MQNKKPVKLNFYVLNENNTCKLTIFSFDLQLILDSL